MTEKRIESISLAESSALAADGLSNLGLNSDRADIESLIETVLAVQQSSLGQIDFYQKAADAVVEMIGLDEGLVVSANSDDWIIAASSSRSGNSPKNYSKQVLEKVVAGKKTFFESFAASSETIGADVQAYVASPIVDTSDRVVGVLFGSRKVGPAAGQCGILRLEALLVQLIAGIFSSGLIREDRRAEASHFQMQLEQFESPKLVQAMKHDSEILEAREREITVLFSDIRGFTGLTERVGTEKTFTMIRNLMNQLTGCILDEEGFIMGYAGDGISAMWNGLSDQPDHAELACWAAVNMQKVMFKLNQFWNFVTGEQLEARIGISTGTAHVGNVGSRWRLHYSALGPCVNLASRLEAANKFFGSSILIAESTKSSLFSRFNTRRIGPVIVKGTDQASNVYELLGEANRAVPQFVQEYETALRLFEAREFANAQQTIVSSIEQNDYQDLAAAELKSQIESHMSNSSNMKPAIRLSSK